jgi:hypothetical protein
VVLTCFNHLEKYDIVNGKDDIPYIMENKTCLKPGLPPTSDSINKRENLT